MASLSDAQPCGVHLVGSLSVSSAESAFTQPLKALPGRLRRLPDGEIGDRDKFVYFQMLLLPAEMHALPERPDFDVPEAKVQEAVRNLGNIKTGYDGAAIESYEMFKRLKRTGEIPEDVRFQVSLPSPVNCVSHARPAYRKALDPVYTLALVEAIKNIVKAIPKEELAIQIDCALDMAYLEGDVREPGYGTIGTPYFEPVMDGLLDRIEALTTHIPSEVELGFHLCYGDLFAKHFKQPKDLRKMVNYANAIMGRIEHRIDWIHVPVPQAREDIEYFVPLTDLVGALSDTQLYLGLVHANDLEGTKRRIATAKKVVGDFGVATECGLGRKTPEAMESVFEIAKAVSQPYPDAFTARD